MDLPTYVKSDNQENFIQALTQTLREGVSDNGFQIPMLAEAEIIETANQYPPIFTAGALWFDTDKKKLVVMTAAPMFTNPPPTPPVPLVNAVLEQITSTAI